MGQPAITSEADVPVVWGNELSEVRARYVDGTYYMDLASVKKGLNARFYYGVQNAQDQNGHVIYCLPTYKVLAPLDSSEVYFGSEARAFDYIPARRIDGEVYLALNFVKQYTNFTFRAFENPRRLQVESVWTPQTVADIRKDTQIRRSGGVKSEILRELEADETVTILEPMETWTKVKTNDAIIGYVENKRLSETRETSPIPDMSYTEPDYQRKLLGTKVNMAFHAIFSTGGNQTLYGDIAQTKTVNVIAPTWYWVLDNAGNISSFATQDYVDACHNMGKQVWAVVDNFNSQTLPDHNTFLQTLESRANLINQLIAQTKNFGIDGINVDLELIEESNGENYIEFIRELSIACRNNSITLSVDNYVPYTFNDFYNIREQGVFADYVVVMGYDEHFAGSTEAGSVASIGYVTDGLRYTTDRVEKSRVINAIPFYARIWFTKEGSVTSEAYGMQDIQNYIRNHNMYVTWNADAGQNYAETTENDTFIQIWVEDAQSIQTKLDSMTSVGIGGVAEWKLGFETADIWDVIANYMAQP